MFRFPPWPRQDIGTFEETFRTIILCTPVSDDSIVLLIQWRWCAPMLNLCGARLDDAIVPWPDAGGREGRQAGREESDSSRVVRDDDDSEVGRNRRE